MELANQEAEERRVQADRAALEKRLRDRMEMAAANEYQRRLRLERLQQQQAEEEEFRARMLAKFAEDERIEQMNAQKRRMKQARGHRPPAAGQPTNVPRHSRLPPEEQQTPAGHDDVKK